ncbi:leucyl aminopeptidase [Motiliproteus sp. MSK22-1]|uniref:leucyl aminopeptidase n=1 Tax=Motiliproteus sp. MSK22-1 TaxID=1897630 RepID=UPI000977A48F|nr:leucyl aminopeptidase [Motiliproteus sp. MSK22-1]OMH38286.1 leucyl aminopeptidase [Motiliproteus sp. MSK22-1]
MEFKITSGSPEQLESQCLVIGVGDGGVLGAIAQILDEAANGYISGVLESGDITGKKTETLLLRAIPGVAAKRTLLIGLGKAEDRNDNNYLKIVQAALSVIKNIQCSDATFCLDLEATNDRDCYWQTRKLVETVSAGLYRFDSLKSTEPTALKLQSVSICLDEEDDETGSLAVVEGAAIANGMSLTRDLGNLPGNICTPTYMAEQARKLAEENPAFSLEVLEESDMKALGMESLLSVSAGSEEPAKLIVLKYQGTDENEQPHVLVGKGITFDSGGISLKPGAGMDEMKFDMCGAASVLGTMAAIAEMDLELNVTAVIAAAENMPSGKATKPGDIVTTMSGQTVEILNTDAEGRLVLCDALTYAERFEPSSVVDIATLTGACILALGHKASGLLSNNDELAAELLEAGQYANDRAWQLPLWDDYQEQLDSNFADMANIGGRPAGTITAACFLSRYTKKYRWAHVDIAGTAWNSSGKEKGATGRCVPLLTQYLIDRTA